MTDTPDRDARHKARMERKKAVVDAAIAAATDTRGVLLVNTGNGKGKSSAAFGVLARAIGHGMRVGVVQFVKGRSDTGEEAFLRRQPEVEWHVMGDGFTWDTQDRSADIASARAGWEQARRFLDTHPESALRSEVEQLLGQTTRRIDEASIQDAQVRVTGKNKDDLQKIGMNSREAAASREFC